MHWSLHEPFLKKLIWIFIVARTAYASALTATQYWVWTHNGPAGMVFANAPVTFTEQTPNATRSFLSLFNFNHGYFTLYSLYHFWLGFFISVLASLLFYAVLFFVYKRKNSSLTKNEILFGLLCSLLSGWPGIVLYVPFALSASIVSNIAQLLYPKVPTYYKNIYVPFILALIALIAWRLLGDPFSLFHLSVLKI